MLKPCAFCGCTEMDTTNPDGLFPLTHDGGWVARCGNPACAAEVVGETKPDAITRWNRRPIRPALATLIPTGDGYMVEMFDRARFDHLRHVGMNPMRLIGED